MRSPRWGKSRHPTQSRRENVFDRLPLPGGETGSQRIHPPVVLRNLGQVRPDQCLVVLLSRDQTLLAGAVFTPPST